MPIEPPRKAQSEPPQTVIVLDDDLFMREAMDSLLKSVGYETRLFQSPHDFLQSPLPDGVRCMVVDVRMPRMSGLDLQARMIGEGAAVPTIFITGHGDIPMSVQAMKAGAVDFLPKPFRDQDLLDAVASALERDRQRRSREETFSDTQRRLGSLTAREREVMALVVLGRLNKLIAFELGLSEITVKMHRRSLMKKMGVQSVAELVRMTEALDRAKSA